jgi:hypothetical protein
MCRWSVASAFLYPRTISVRRSKTNAAGRNGAQLLGLVDYSGREQPGASAAGERVLFTGLPAAVQLRRAGRTRGTSLPGDIADKPEWQIMIPAASLPQYSIRDRDIIVDDEGYRYGVAANTYTGLGYQLTCVRLEN